METIQRMTMLAVVLVAMAAFVQHNFHHHRTDDRLEQLTYKMLLNEQKIQDLAAHRAAETEQRLQQLEAQRKQKIEQRRQQIEPKSEKPTDNFKVVYLMVEFPHEQLDRFCLAKNIYHEARGESLLGQYAVAQVTLNRVKHSRWPNDICHVVMQPRQFSWTNRADQKWTHPNDSDWRRAQDIAAEVLDRGARVRGLESALFYHTDWVNPNWRSQNYEIAQIDTHIFYAGDRKL